MADNVDNLMLEQLRLIREDLKRMDGRMTDMEQRLTARLDDVEVSIQSVEGILISLGGYVRGLDKRVEHIEAKLGIE